MPWKLLLLWATGQVDEVAKTKSHSEFRFLNDPTGLGAWEGRAAWNEIRSERLPAIIIEAKSRNMRCAQGRTIDLGRYRLRRPLGERSGDGAHSRKAGG